MENRVNTILIKLENNQYPDNGAGISWGIGVRVCDIDLNTFKAPLLLKEKVAGAKGNIHDDDEGLVQLIIDYKNNSWIVNLEFLTEDSDIPVAEYSIIVSLTREQVKMMIESILNSGTRMIDSRCRNV
jgi:hypothetical protein